MDDITEDKLNALFEGLRELPGYEDVDFTAVKEVLKKSRGRKPMKAFPVDDFDEVEERMMSVSGSSTVTALCHALLTAPLTYSRSRNKKEVPCTWLWNLLWAYCVNPYWILYGGDNLKYLAPSDHPALSKV